MAVVCAACGVEAPEFRDADLRVDGRLAVEIPLRRALRGNFYRQVRRLAHFPGQVNLAWPNGRGVHPERQVDVRRDPHVQVARVVADERLIIKKDVRPAVKVGASGGDQAEQFAQFLILFHVIRRCILDVGVEFQAGIVDFALLAVGQHRSGGGSAGGHDHPSGRRQNFARLSGWILSQRY